MRTSVMSIYVEDENKLITMKENEMKNKRECNCFSNYVHAYSHISFMKYIFTELNVNEWNYKLCRRCISFILDAIKTNFSL